MFKVIIRGCRITERKKVNILNGIKEISKNNVSEGSRNSPVKCIMAIVLLVILIAGDPVFAEAADAGTKSVDMIKGSAMSTDFDAVSLNGMAEESGGKEEQSEVVNFVSRLYRVALDREGDEAGLSDWTSRLLQKRETAAEVAWGFVFSDEFQNRGYTDEQFVELLYEIMFGRSGDEEGKQYWITYLGNGVSRQYVYRGFAESVEFSNLCAGFGVERGNVSLSAYRDNNPNITAFFAGFYTKLLDRNFDAKGLEYWCKAYFTKEMVIEEIAEKGFLHSEEFKGKNYDDETFVVKMYETFLNREPDEAGLRDWVQRLKSGKETRDSIVRGFVYSEEFCKRIFYLEKPEVDLIIFMGQSNMSGAGGNAAQAPALVYGAGYEFRAITDANNLYVLKEPFGENEHKENGCDDRFILKRSGTMVTAFVNAYYENTGTPVVAVSASRGSTHVREWAHGETKLKEDAAERLTCARNYLEQNGFRIRHIYMVWYQGESDAISRTPAYSYKRDFLSFFSYMQGFGVEKCFMVEIGYHFRDSEQGSWGKAEGYQAIMLAQTEICRESENIILATTIAPELQDKSNKWYDEVHFNQNSLNRIGWEAGQRAGQYTISGQ